MRLKEEKNAPAAAGRNIGSDGGGSGKAEVVWGADGAEQADSSQSRRAVARTERVKPQHRWRSSGVALLFPSWPPGLEHGLPGFGERLGNACPRRSALKSGTRGSHPCSVGP